MQYSLTLCTFDGVDGANRAKQALHGADIYSGCCTLQIQYAKVTSLHQLFSYWKKNQSTAKFILGSAYMCISLLED